MSYDFILYARGDELPPSEQLDRELANGRPSVVLPGDFDLRTARGYVPVVADGRNAGFEVSCVKIREADSAGHKAALTRAGEPDDEFLEIMTSCDTRVTFRCRDDGEITVARRVAGALATLSGAYLCDPQTDVTVKGRYFDALGR